MPRALKFSGLLVIHAVLAIFGTAIVDGALRWAIPPHSVTAVIWRECVTSILGAASLGFSLWRIWPNPGAKWAWVIPAAWFTCGLLFIAGGLAGPSDIFNHFSGFVFKNNSGAEDVLTFSMFTIPFLRGVAYSVGAYISSMLRPLSFPSNVVRDRSPQQ
jgi:hypothetical protein